MRNVRVIGIAVAALAAGLSSLEAAGTRSEPPRIREAKALQRITLTFEAGPLKDAFRELEAAAGVSIRPLWRDARHHIGLDPEAEVTIHLSNVSIFAAMDRLLETIDVEEGGGATWQRAADGAWQIGPRSRLNAYKRVHLYDISDLIRIIPNHRSGPSIDLQQALTNSGSPITGTDAGGQWLEELPPMRDRAEELVDLIQAIVEPDQWSANGGNGGTIRIVGSTLIVNAPDYLHRALSAQAAR